MKSCANCDISYLSVKLEKETHRALGAMPLALPYETPLTITGTP